MIYLSETNIIFSYLQEEDSQLSCGGFEPWHLIIVGIWVSSIENCVNKVSQQGHI